MSALEYRDPAWVTKVLPFMRLVMKGYFRSDVKGMEKVPEGGALLVGNHSGGLTPMDVPIILISFVDTFGPDRPLYCLAHDMLFISKLGPIMRKFGFVNATREAAHEILTDGGVTIVFPGGDYDTYRPSRRANIVDFNGRKGYIKTALRAGVPIVPVVSIGGQEAQLFIARGEWLARRLGVKKLLRSDVLPLTFGFPFGFATTLPPNLPLPTKISTTVLDPIDIEAEFGPDPDFDEVDAFIRSRMQETLQEMSAARRFPVLG